MEVVFNLLIFSLMLCSLQLCWILATYSVGLLADTTIKVKAALEAIKGE